MENPVVHFEVTGRDALALQKFYSDLFGWQIQNMPEMNNYGVISIEDNERGIGGGVGGTMEGGDGQVTFYVETDDLQATLDKAEKLGGKVVMPIMEVPGVVTMAMFADPEGHEIGIVAPQPPPAG